MLKWIVLTWLLLLVACQTNEVGVVATADLPTQTAVAQATATTPATATPLPTPTETAVPPTTPPPTASETAVPPTPSPTRTPRSTATSRPSITLSSTPAYPETQDSFHRVALLPTELPGQIMQLRFWPTNPNTLQLITDAGYLLISLADGTVTTFPAPPTHTVVAVDNRDRMWSLPADGETISVTDPNNQTTTFGTELGWLPAANQVNDWAQDNNNHLWLATEVDVRQFDGLRWTVYSRAAMGMPPPVQPDVLTLFSLTVSPLTQTVWVGECDWGGPGPLGGGGVRWFDGSLWHGSDAPTAVGCVTQVAEGKNGRIWVPLDDQLWQFHPADSSWQSFTPSTAPGIGRIGYTEQLLLDNQSNPWPLFSLCGGASCQTGFARYRLRDGQWAQIGEITDVIPTLVFNAHNLPTFFYYMQMVRFSATDEPQPVPQFELWVETAVYDETGNIWLVARPSPDLPLAIWHALET